MTVKKKKKMLPRNTYKKMCQDLIIQKVIKIY